MEKEIRRIYTGIYQPKHEQPLTFFEYYLTEVQLWTSPMFDMMESAKADANQNKGDVHMSLGKVIRKYRKIRNLTQEEMAGRLGVTAPAVNKWENENSYPDITLLAPIARLLGISLDTLLSFREELTAEEITGMIREADQKLKMNHMRKYFSGQRKTGRISKLRRVNSEFCSDL